jgi:hypothetical protein
MGANHDVTLVPYYKLNLCKQFVGESLLLETGEEWCGLNQPCNPLYLYKQSYTVMTFLINFYKIDVLVDRTVFSTTLKQRFAPLAVYLLHAHSLRFMALRCYFKIW